MDTAPAGSISLPVWLFLLIVSVSGSALTMIVIGTIQFTKLKALADSLAAAIKINARDFKDTIAAMTLKIESLTMTAASLEADVRVLKELRKEDRRHEERMERRTPIVGVEEYVAPPPPTRHHTPPPINPKKGGAGGGT